jgi:hypothetical protein
MSERPKSPAQQARDERLSKALRENLKRRKAQSRERNAPEKGEKPQHSSPQRPDR